MKTTILLTLVLAAALAGCQGAPTSSIDSRATVKDGISEVSPAEARPAIEAAYSQFIDVRTPEEYAAGHAYRARNIPLDTLSANLDKLERNEPVYIICRTDNRSRQAAEILNKAGFSKVVVITGGTDAWQSAGMPMATPASLQMPEGLDEQTRKALDAALEDERRAAASYAAVLAKFPDARPFVNVINAERQHQAELLDLYARHKLQVPADPFDAAKMPVPASLAEACRTAVKAEEDNIAMYDGFFKYVKDPGVRQTFTRLQAASRENHLPAFRRCSERGGGGGPGRRGQ